MTGSTFATLLLPAAAAFVLSAAFTPIMKRVAVRFDAVARPTADRWHRKTVPLLGGVAVWLATVIVVFATSPGQTGHFLVAVATATAMMALGVADDRLRLRPSTKLGAQIAAACVLVVGGFRLEWTGSEALNALLTIFWFVGITNAFNLLDNMDGLCSGVGGIAALSCAAILMTSAPDAAAYAVALAGAAGGFLLYNFNPASIFLGDSGSLFIGASLAVLTLMGTREASTGLMSALAAPVLVLLIPIFDTTLVTVARKLSARSASVGGRDHTSHRLVALGFSERQTALLLYAVTAVAGVAAVATRYGQTEGLAIGGLVGVTAVLLGVALAHVRVYGEQDFTLLKGRSYTPLLVDVAYKRRAFEILLDVCLIAIAYYTAYVLRFDTALPLHYARFLESLPIVIALSVLSLFAAGAYRGVWRYFGAADAVTFAKGVATGTIASVIALVYMYHFRGYSRGVFIIYGVLLSVLLMGSRLSFRLLGDFARQQRPAGKRALIYGAGDGGVLLVRELRNNPTWDYRVIGFIDDEAVKRNKRVFGVPVLGSGDELPAIMRRHRAEAVIVSSEKIEPARLDVLVRCCSEQGIPVLFLRFRLESLSVLQQPR